MSCEYCRREKPQRVEALRHNDAWELRINSQSSCPTMTVGVGGYVFDDYVEVSAEFYANFCPMCGRDLRDMTMEIDFAEVSA